VALDTSILAIVAPALVSDERAADVLALCEQQHTAARWGDVYALAMAYLAAHILTVCPSSAVSAGGEVTSRSAGDLSETYATPAAATTEGALRGSAYGRAFLQLRGTRAYAGPRIASVR
jgi:hypothetical protein